MKIPQIKDVIPLTIAQKLLFVMWYLGWVPKYGYPLGVVIAAIPKGLTLYHGERLLLAHHHINTAPVDDLNKDDFLALPATKSSLPHNDHAFTIDPQEATAFDDALTLEPVASDDGIMLPVWSTHHQCWRSCEKEKGNEVDVNAQTRATAVYGCPKYFPLLPEKVSESLSLSCRIKKSKISHTCEVRVDGDGRIVANTIKIHESLVQSRAQLTYEEVQHSLTGVHDVKLNEKVTTYNETLSTNKDFGLEQRLALV